MHKPWRLTREKPSPGMRPAPSDLRLPNKDTAIGAVMQAVARGSRTLAFAWLLLTVSAVLSPGYAAAVPEASSLDVSEILRSGWFEREPYQFRPSAPGAAPTGLDLRILRKALDGLGLRVRYDPMLWQEQIEAMERGELDLIVGAYYDAERERFAYFSEPYRFERNALYLHRDAPDFETIDDFLHALKTGRFRLGASRDYAFADRRVGALVAAQPTTMQLFETADDNENLQALREGVIDGFVGDPLQVDLLLARDGVDGVRRSGLDLGRVAVHVMVSRVTQSAEWVAELDREIEALRVGRQIAQLEIEHVLPAFLAVTTREPWFNLLNLLGILAFSASGVLLARRERYNLFGALVLATLPAIGGGVLRDLLLGRPLFIFESPELFMAPLVVVVLGFLSFQLHDQVLVRVGAIARGMARTREGMASVLVGNVHRVLDAWALAAFTVIGVGVAAESQAGPLWLWGPTMGVITAAFGVILRDIVRSDFNIGLLKRDSFAEISLAGGTLYSLLLLWPPVELSLTFILWLTNGMIVLLFLIRLGVLYSGRGNPLQMGDPHSVPEKRLQKIEVEAAALWGLLATYLTEDREGRACSVPAVELELLHKEFGYSIDPLIGKLNAIAAEPLFESTVLHHQNLRKRLVTLQSLEGELYAHLQDSLRDSLDSGSVATALAIHFNEGLRSLLDTMSDAAKSRDPEDLEWLGALTQNLRNRFDTVRARHLRAEAAAGGDLEPVLQRSHRVERMTWLLADYVQQALHPSAGQVASDRRNRQTLALG